MRSRTVADDSGAPGGKECALQRCRRSKDRQGGRCPRDPSAGGLGDRSCDKGERGWRTARGAAAGDPATADGGHGHGHDRGCRVRILGEGGSQRHGWRRACAMGRACTVACVKSADARTADRHAESGRRRGNGRGNGFHRHGKRGSAGRNDSGARRSGRKEEGRRTGGLPGGRCCAGRGNTELDGSRLGGLPTGQLLL